MNLTVPTDSGNFKPHPEGIHPAVCIDVIDLGLVKTEFQGVEKMVNKVRLVFETESLMEDGKPFIISKTFTASLHPKARLNEFLGKWRGKPLAIGEDIDLKKLLGACCTLVSSIGENVVGKKYANIDAVSKATKKLAASGHYDPAAARKRIADWNAKQGAAIAQGHAATIHPPAAANPNPGDDIPYDADVGF